MAGPIDPQLASEVNTPSYLGYSKGSTPNTSTAELIKGAGDKLQMDVQAVDTFFQNSIKDEAYKKIDPIREQYGEEPATKLILAQETARKLGTAPDEVQKRLGELSTVKDAYDSKAMSETRYWYELNNVAKELRARYPGYREQIDQTISQIVGTTPANKLVQEVMTAVNAKAGQSEEQKILHGIETDLTTGNAIKEGVDPTEYWQRKAQGKPMNATEAQVWLTGQKMKAFALQNEVNRIKLNKELGNNTQEDMSKLAIKQVSGLYGDNILGLAGGSEGVGELRKQIANAQDEKAKTGIISDDTYKNLTAAIGKMEFTLRAKREEILNKRQPWGSSYVESLNSTQLEDIRKRSDDQIAFFKDAVSKKNFDLLSSSLDAMDLAKKNTEHEALQNTFLREAFKLRTAMGDTAVNYFLGLANQKDPTLVDSYLKTLKNSVEASSINSKKTLGETLDMYKGQGKPQLMGGTVDKFIDAIKDDSGNLPQGFKRQLIENMYGNPQDTFLTKIDKDQRIPYYNKLIDPNLAAAIKKEATPQQWDKYINWVKANAINLYQPEINRAIELQNNRFLKMDFDGTKFVGSVISDPAKNENLGTIGNFLGTAVDSAKVANWQDSINRVNSIIAGITPIVKMNGGDTTAALKEVIEAAGLQASGGGKAHDPFIEAVDKFIAQGGNANSPMNQTIKKNEEILQQQQKDQRRLPSGFRLGGPEDRTTVDLEGISRIRAENIATGHPNSEQVWRDLNTKYPEDFRALPSLAKPDIAPTISHWEFPTQITESKKQPTGENIDTPVPRAETYKVMVNGKPMYAVLPVREFGGGPDTKTDEEVLSAYKKSGLHFGIYKDEKAADELAQQLNALHIPRPSFYGYKAMGNESSPPQELIDLFIKWWQGQKKEPPKQPEPKK